MDTIRYNRLKHIPLIAVLLLMSAGAHAETYYVALNGNDANPGSQSQPFKTIGKANGAVLAGDTVIIGQGTYTGQQINPNTSGTSGNLITYKSKDNETATISGDCGSSQADLSNTDYITLEHINFQNANNTWVNLNNATYCVVENCTFSKADNWRGITMDGSQYCKILDNTFAAGCDRTLETAVGDGDEADCCPCDFIWVEDADYNLIQGNTFGKVPHICITLYGRSESMYNIVRDNTFRNEWHAGLGVGENAQYTLVEDNVVIDCGEEKEENYCGYYIDRVTRDRAHQKGFQFFSRYIIARNNVHVNNGQMYIGTYNNNLPTRDCRIYNNTFYNNYYGVKHDNAVSMIDIVFKNNTFEARSENKEIFIWGATDTLFLYNDFSDQEAYYKGTTGLYSAIETAYSDDWQNNMSESSGFVDAAGRDFRLKDNSPLIDAGDFLTRTASAGSGKTLTVDDALYFIDGFGIVEGDVIQLEGQTNRFRITHVDYSNNKITVDTPLSWQKGQGVALAYNGAAPDIGAFEHHGSSADNLPVVPRRLRTVQTEIDGAS